MLSNQICICGLVVEEYLKLVSFMVVGVEKRLLFERMYVANVLQGLHYM